MYATQTCISENIANRHWMALRIPTSDVSSLILPPMARTDNSPLSDICASQVLTYLCSKV